MNEFLEWMGVIFFILWCGTLMIIIEKQNIEIYNIRKRIKRGKKFAEEIEEEN